MTPEELARMRTLIRQESERAAKTAVRDAEQRWQDDLNDLRQVDRRHDQRLGSHSGTHKGLADEVRKSESIIKASTTDMLVAQTHHTQETLERFRKELLEELPKLVRATTATEGRQAAMAVDVELTEDHTRKNVTLTKVTATLAVLSPIIVEVLKQLFSHFRGAP